MQYIAMFQSRIIHVALATAEPMVANRLLKSIQQALPSFEVNASVLLFGMAEPLNNDEFCVPVDVIDSLNNFPPIVESRNICQSYLRHRMLETGGVGFILDDDLMWALPEYAFIALIDELLGKGCDMAFSALSGDSPIPKEYTRASPLLDVLMAINDHHIDDDVKSINEYVKGVGISSEGYSEVNAHHDFYSFKPEKFHRYDVNLATLKWQGFIENLAKGKTTTRNIHIPRKIYPASGRERGGATIIFNPDVLLHKNDALRCLNFISRRSDMIMAQNAKNYNFKLFNTPPIFEHVRDEVFDSKDCKKLIGDILGYALVEAKSEIKYSRTYFEFHLSNRIEQTNLLLKETSKMLTLLDEWLVKHHYIGKNQSNVLRVMVLENNKTILALKSIDLNKVLESFNQFAVSKINDLNLSQLEN